MNNTQHCWFFVHQNDHSKDAMCNYLFRKYLIFWRCSAAVNGALMCRWVSTYRAPLGDIYTRVMCENWKDLLEDKQLSTDNGYLASQKLVTQHDRLVLWYGPLRLPLKITTTLRSGAVSEPTWVQIIVWLLWVGESRGYYFASIFLLSVTEIGAGSRQTAIRCSGLSTGKKWVSAITSEWRQNRQFI